MKAPRIDWRIVALVILACVVAALVGFTTPYAISGSNAATAVQKGTEIQGCRAIASAAVTDATNTWNQARARNEILANRFEDALVNGDATALYSLRADLTPARTAIAETAQALDKRNDEYQTAVRLSNADPDAFLARCHATAPTRPNPATTSTTTVAAVGVPTTLAPTTTARKVRRTTTTTAKPTTTTSGTTSTTFRSSPKPTSPPSTCLTLPLFTIPSEVPCL